MGSVSLNLSRILLTKDEKPLLVLEVDKKYRIESRLFDGEKEMSFGGHYVRMPNMFDNVFLFVAKEYDGLKVMRNTLYAITESDIVSINGIIINKKVLQ